MRFYAAGNYYLSSIQQGIQAAHVLGEMITKYPSGDGPVGEQLSDWRVNHKTMILLNGGNADSLRGFYSLLERSDASALVFAKFNEDAQSLDNALTSVGIIVPARLYDATWTNDAVYGFAGAWVDTTGKQLAGWEAEFVTALKGMSLAR